MYSCGYLNFWSLVSSWKWCKNITNFLRPFYNKELLYLPIKIQCQMCNLLYWTSESLDTLSDNICDGEDEWTKVSCFFFVSYFQVFLSCIWQCYKFIHPVKAGHSTLISKRVLLLIRLYNSLLFQNMMHFVNF